MNTTILMWNTVLLVALSAVIALTAELWLPIVASGFDPDKMLLTRKLLYCSLPIVIFTGFSTTRGALLNAGERFALVAIAPALQSIAIIVMVAVLFRHSGIHALLAGTLLGVLLETAVVGAALHRQGHH